MNYYIVVRKDSDVYADKAKGWSEIWGDYKHQAVLNDITQGDKILCYLGACKGGKRFIAQLVALGSVKKYKNERFIEFAFENRIDVPLDRVQEHYEQILALNPATNPPYSPFTRNGKNLFYGSYFATTKEQFEFILRLNKMEIK